MKTCPVCDTPYPNQHNTCPTDGAVLIESHELAPGHIVRGKYRIVRKLGQGGMGIVYLAEHMLLGGQVALKFLAIELSRNPQFVKRFRNEARAAYQFRHPNIIEVTDLDQDEGGNLFIAMEYVAGPNLRTALRETKGPIPAVRALQVARGVAAGLAAAHARGAVHRDIKPENILLALEPSGEVQPKVLDFGIAAMAENITNRSHTQGLLLTPAYASPEQWRGTPADQLDGRTDLYALGGVLYEMLTGRTPFRASNPEGWMFQHLQGVPEPLGHLRPDLLSQYPGLDAVVMRLLAREREQRFDSAIDALEALSPEPLASRSAKVGSSAGKAQDAGLPQIRSQHVNDGPELAARIPANGADDGGPIAARLGGQKAKKSRGALFKLAPGDIVRGKYRIVSQLGQDWMGIAYLADYQKFGRQVALKFMAPWLSPGTYLHFAKRFRYEACQLHHPNIVEVTDMDQDEDGNLFIAMEYVVGPSLLSVLREAKGPLPVDRALRIARDVAAGLEAAHARGAFHFDIKPQNILLGKGSDGEEQAKVLGFGIAMMLDGLQDDIEGPDLGPREFIAPEQLLGAPVAELDGRTDLYALGRVLYEMLSGRPPFQGEELAQRYQGCLQGNAPPLGALRPDLPRENPGLDAVVMRLLAREREQRFSSVTALLEALATLPPGSRVPPTRTPEPQIEAKPTIPVDQGPGRILSFASIEPSTRLPRWVAGSSWLLIPLSIALVAWIFRYTLATADVPTLVPKGGEYAVPHTIEIYDSTAFATIHYTLDGSPPTEASPTYRHGLTSLPSGAVVRAIATAPGLKTSDDIKGVYIWSRADQDARAKADQDARAKADQDARAKADQDARERAARERDALAVSQSRPQDTHNLAIDRENLGIALFGKRRYIEAKPLFEMACNGGNMIGCRNIGWMYHYGLGVSKDDAQARHYYQIGCAGGDVPTCNYLNILDQGP